MRRLILFLMLVVAPAPAQTVTSDPSRALVSTDLRELPMRTVGRMQAVPLGPPFPAGATAYRHQWPGVYWEAAFRGDAVVLSFDDPWNEYRLFIDAKPPIALAQPGRAQVRVAGLGSGRHTVRLQTITESIDHIASFEGFYAEPRKLLSAPRPQPLQIEFIGDSSMAGYGIRSTTTTCTPEQIRLTTDAGAAYPAIVAKRLGADYEVNAISGRGLVRNYADFLEGQPLPAAYPYTFVFDRTVPAQDGPDWHPNLYVVRLWADFVTGLKPGEKWPNDAALATDYADSMVRFVTQLHARSPEAAILVWWFDAAQVPDPRGRAVLDAIRERIVAGAHAAEVATIDVSPFPPVRFDGSACDHHGSLADHARMADAVYDYLLAHPADLPGATLSPAARPTAAPARP